MIDATLLLRQVNPSWLQSGRITSQVFKPTLKDNNRLSVYDGDKITAREAWEHFTINMGLKSVGVMGDGRTYDNVVAIRSVDTNDFMTADWSRIPYEVLATISNRIINEVRGINRVVYDISSKPPATIEWE